MSDMFTRAMAETDPWKDAEKGAGFLVKQFPMIAQILLGDPPTKEKTGRLPGSVRLFTNAGEIKACIQGREWLFDGYVLLPKEPNLLEALELELDAGRIGWSKSSEQKNSKNKPTY